MRGVKARMVRLVSENFKTSSHPRKSASQVRLQRWTLAVAIQRSSMLQAKYLSVAPTSMDSWASAVLTQWRQE